MKHILLKRLVVFSEKRNNLFHSKIPPNQSLIGIHGPIQLKKLNSIGLDQNLHSQWLYSMKIRTNLTRRNPLRL